MFCLPINQTHVLLLFLLVNFSTKPGRSTRLPSRKDCIPPLGDSCIEIRQCQFFVDLLDKSHSPRSKQVIRIIRNHHCGFEGDSPKVCCFTAKQPSNTDKNRTIKGINSDVSHHENLNLLPSENCGNIRDEFRIINGYKTVIFEFPWMVLIAYKMEQVVDLACSGSLINDRYVLTAAHCVQNLNLEFIRLGEHNIETEHDCNYIKGVCSPPIQDVNIEKVLVHPGYVAKSFENDIALIRLSNKLEFSQPHIQPICLPFGKNAELNLDRRFGVISGWGITESGFKSTELLKTYIPIISNEDCKKLYDKRSVISPEQICAGGFKGRDSCGGDSGGPLTLVGRINSTIRYIQYGIVSYGPKHCGTDGQPGVYTRVTHYMKWILDHLEPS